MDVSAWLSRPPNDVTAPVKALWLQGNGEWEKAHACVQDESSADAAWVHAHLHRVEGDKSNALYWYRLAGRPMPATSTDQEWRQLVEALKSTYVPA